MGKEINICIVHYNTPYLTECLIKSINKFVPKCKIYIFDNSDKLSFTYRQDNITYFDNTKGQIIDFDKWLSNIKTKVASANNYASAKHCYTIQKCIELINNNFILLDSDTLLKKDISEIYDDNYIYVADNEKWQGNERVIPYCCFINVKKCKENNVKYYNEKYVVGLTHSCRFDTGAYFYVQCKDYPHKKINYKDYVVHLDDGSQRYSNKSKQTKWLNENKKLWENNVKTVEVNKLETMADYRKDIERIGKSIGLNFNLDNPKTIQEKIQWLKLHDSTPLKTKCADKIKVREYCKEKLGKDICIPIIKIYNKTDEIKWDELPNKFVIKCNHGSGMNIIVKDKNILNKQDTINKLNKWMQTDFAFQNGCELQYHNIERKIFVEEYKEDTNQKNSLFDYKFWCFNGEPKFMTVNDGYGHGKMSFFDLNFNELSFERVDFKKLVNAKKPVNFDLMIEYSKILSKDFKFVRVDFYEINNKLYLGELTFTPNSGYLKFRNSEDGIVIGNMLDLNLNEIKNKKVVYTCIIGNYDSLLEPEFVTEGYDYVCFTDQDFMSKVWEIRPVPEELKELNEVKRQRNIKINTHKYLSEYDFSVWVDGNITLKDDINKYVEKNCIEKDCVMFVGTHPQRDCIYEEGEACIKLKKETKENVNRQLNIYREEGFPEHYGLLQSCIIFRYHNNESCKRLMEAWWEQLEKYSHRDQLSFNYVLWKNQDVKIQYLNKNIFNCETFKWNVGHKKTKITNKTKEKMVKKQVKKTTPVVKKVVKKETPKVVKKEVKKVEPKVVKKVEPPVLDKKMSCKEKLELLNKYFDEINE